MILFLKTFSWETLGTDEFLGLNLLSFPVGLKMLDEDSLLMSAVYGECMLETTFVDFSYLYFTYINNQEKYIHCILYVIFLV